MEEQAKQMEQGQEEVEGVEAKEEAQPSEGVVLSPEQYNAILDHISTLEARLMEQPKGAQQVQKLDHLIEEAQQGQPKRQVAPAVPLDEMTPQQVLSQLYGAIQTNLIQPLETKVETLRIMSEIDKVANKAGNEDFWEYAQQVKEIAIKNPTLSIQQAYNLAKADGKRGPALGDKGLQKKSDTLFTLPPRPKVMGGEKPGASGSGMKGTAPLSRRDAASEAFDRVTKASK